MQEQLSPAPREPGGFKLTDVKTWFRPDEVPQDMDLRTARRDIVRIVWPAFAELILVSLTSMVDMMMVGDLGTWAISSVGLTTQPKFILMSILIAVNTGVTAIIARAKGAQNYEETSNALAAGLTLTMLIGAVMTVAGYFLSEWMVVFMGGIYGETVEPATAYLQIQMLGFLPMAMTLTITASLRGIGHTRISMLYNTAANVFNVFFNWVFIFGKFGAPRMEVAGASLATVIGQFIAFLIAISCILKGYPTLRLKLSSMKKFNLSLVKRISKVGTPAMIEQIIMRIGMILYVRVVAGLGTDAYATHQIAMNILQLSFMNGQAFGISATSLMGQSLGRKRPDQAKIYVRETRRYGMLVSCVIGVAFFFFGKYVVALYIDDATVIAMGASLLRVIAVLQPFQCSSLILNGALRGAGDTVSVAVVMSIGVLLVRPLLCYLFVDVLAVGLIGAWYALASDQLMRSAGSFIRYKTDKWKYIRV